MSAIRERFRRQRGEKRAGFIPFIVAGDPDLATTADLLVGLSALKPIAIELGVPFSDPTADGPIIQRAAQRSLERGTQLGQIFRMLRELRGRAIAPVILFTYYNPVLQFGLEKFADQAAAAEVAGVLAVDLPAEAAEALRLRLRARGVDLIFLAAPTTTDERLQEIARKASGFIYAVARTGVTGTLKQLADESQALVRRIRRATDLPVAVGFGITNRAAARRVCRYADAAVVGSRLVAEIENAAEQEKLGRAALVRRVVQCARQFI